MQKRALVVAAAAAATVVGLTQSALAILPTKYLENQFVHNRSSLMAPISPKDASSYVQVGGSVAGSGEASGVWVGPAFTRGDATNFPTNNTFGFWNNAANWSGGVPDGGDSATFNELGLIFGITPLMNTGETRTLTALTDNTEAGANITTFRTGAQGTINVPAAGLNYTRSLQSIEFSPTRSRLADEGEGYWNSFSGSGTLNFNGSGNFFLARDNSGFTGRVNINGGRVSIVSGILVTTDQPQSATLSIGRFGTASSATITINGGALYTGEAIAGAPENFIIDRPIVIGPNGAYFQSSFVNWGNGAQQGFITLAGTGSVHGSGRLRWGLGSDGAIENSNPGFTGELVFDDYIFMQMRGGGSMPNASQFTNFGRLDLDNITGAAENNRLADGAPHHNYGAEFHLTDASGVNINERIGTYFSDHATNIISIETNSNTNTVTLSAPGITRLNNSFVRIRGRNLGAAAGGFGRILLDAMPAGMVGGVVPWMDGITGTSTAVNASKGVGLTRPVIYDVGTDGTFGTADDRGLRPLTAPEMTASIGAGGNVLITAAAAGSGTVNSLTVSGANAVTGGGIHVTSGLVIGDTPGGSIANDLTSSNEMIFATATPTDQAAGGAAGNAAPAGLTVSGKITAPRLSTGGYGDTILTNPANAISGTITVNMGRLIATTEGALGGSSDPIVINNGTYMGDETFGTTNESHLVNGSASGTFNINRPIRVLGETATSTGAAISGVGTTSYTKLNGAITIGDAPATYNFNTLTLNTGTIDVNTTISGPGTLVVRGPTGGSLSTGVDSNTITLAATTVILRNANTFSGGTELNPESSVRHVQVQIGNNNAFGTGELFFAGSALLSSLDGAAYTIPNNLKMYVGPAFAGTGLLKFTGTIDLNFFNTTWMTTGASQVELAGPVKNGNLIKAGSGTLTLSGNNAQFGGGLQVGQAASATLALRSGGVLIVAHPNGLGTGGGAGNNNTVLTGSTLRLAPVGGDINANDNFSINGAGIADGSTTFGAIHNAAGNNTIGDIFLTNFIFEAGGTTFDTPISTIRVDAGSSLTADEVLDFSGPVIAPPDPNPAPTIPTLVGEGTAQLIKTGAGMLQVNSISNAKTNTGTLSPFNEQARYSFLTPTKKAIGGISVQGGTLKVSAGGTSNQPAKHTVVEQVIVNTGAGAKLDLTNNSLIVDYTGASPRAAIEALIDSAHNGGAWDGAGITSSSANASNFALGVAEATDTSFSGSYLTTPIDATAVLVRFTRYGDVNLDGTTNIGDFAILGANFNTPGRWATGDVNYDGSVNIGDFSLLAANFNLSAGDAMARGAVPEPASLSLLALAGMGLARRRRA